MQNAFNNQRAIIAAFFPGKTSTASEALKTVFACLLLFVSESFNGFAQPNTWTQKNDLGHNATNVPERVAAISTGFSIGNKGYILTSNDSGKYFWEYDPGTDIWTQKADFEGMGRFNPFGLSIGNKGYIGMGAYSIGGYPNYGYYQDVWEYDPFSNSWSRKADFPGIGRLEPAGFSINDKGYVGMGYDYRDVFENGNTNYYRDFWEYDPAADSWVEKSYFPSWGREGSVSFSLGNSGYFGLGEYSYCNEFGYCYGEHFSDFWEYNPTTDVWTSEADFGGGARTGAIGFSTSTKGYIGSGYQYGYMKDLWEYDPFANTWTQKADFVEALPQVRLGFSIGDIAYFVNSDDNAFWEYDPNLDNWALKKPFDESNDRWGAAGFSIENKGYIGTGGWDYKKDFWEYDISTGTWMQKADFGGTGRNQAVGFSIGTKGYIGTGQIEIYPFLAKDFWEYDPAANIWTRKANFGGSARNGAVGFSIGNKGYIGTGSNTKDLWEYDPASNIWTQKADFAGTARSGAVGFSIGSKGYIGTGSYYGYNDFFGDFWEYDPATNGWTQKADFAGTARSRAIGFSIGTKGYIGTGQIEIYPFLAKDFWEYDPAANTWTHKTDFGGSARSGAVGFSIGSKGYVGTGVDGFNYRKDFWEYTPRSCPIPYNLRVPKISDTCVRLNWNVPDALIEHVKVSYRAVGSSTWIEDRKKSLENSKWICGLTPNTTYEWKVRNICADEKTEWVKGPNFATLPLTGFASNAIAANGIKGQGNINAQIIPNPTKGSFVIQMYLPGKTALTILSLYNNLGEKIWQQDAGRLSGSVGVPIALENKLPPGLHVLLIQRGSERLMQKVVVIK